jgi:hypothetical protein
MKQETLEEAAESYRKEYDTLPVVRFNAFVAGGKWQEERMYTQEDMIKYSNWLFEWCEYNKYRKLIDGVKPYGSGEFISDKDMFNKFLNETMD